LQLQRYWFGPVLTHAEFLLHLSVPSAQRSISAHDLPLPLNPALQLQLLFAGPVNTQEASLSHPCTALPDLQLFSKVHTAPFPE
jgi:hypothetical protein